jgi:outer membrane biosynthesis protein TonB
MNETFGKTAKGQDEIKTRVAGLSQKLRQVLIFVDGKRTVEELKDMLKADDINEMLTALAEQGLVEKVAAAKPAAAPVAVAPPPPPPKAAAPEEAAPMSEKDIKAAEKRQKQLERERELAIERALSSRM